MIKIIFSLFLAASLQCFCSEPVNISDLLERMVEVKGSEYLSLRNKITSIGEDALPKLEQVISDKSACWRRQLAARICYERILMGSEIELFIDRDWNGMVFERLPSYQPVPADNDKPDNANEITFELDVKPGTKIIPRYGVKHLIKEDFILECKKLGSWYYFIEINWKDTNEIPEIRYTDVRQSWPEWCANAVRKQPEKLWLCLALQERLLSIDLELYSAQKLYRKLLDDGEPVTVPSLLKRFFDFVDKSTLSAKPGSDRWNKAVLRTYTRILEFSNFSHVDQLAEVMARHPPLESMREKLEDIRKKRPPTEPDPREVFRVGREPVETSN